LPRFAPFLKAVILSFKAVILSAAKNPRICGCRCLFFRLSFRSAAEKSASLSQHHREGWDVNSPQRALALPLFLAFAVAFARHSDEARISVFVFALAVASEIGPGFSLDT
jgi:hypothetical protein